MKWFFKSDLRKKDDAADAWTSYSANESSKLEQAYQSGKKMMTLNSKYKINFTLMIQHRGAYALLKTR